MENWRNNTTGNATYTQTTNVGHEDLVSCKKPLTIITYVSDSTLYLLDKLGWLTK